MNRLICMSFDGSHVTERAEFATPAAAWAHAEDMGSCWVFYPFVFVASASGQTIADAPPGFEHLKRRRVRTVAALFAALAALPELKDAGPEEFGFAVQGVML